MCAFAHSVVISFLEKVFILPLLLYPSGSLCQIPKEESRSFCRAALSRPILQPGLESRQLCPQPPQCSPRLDRSICSKGLICPIPVLLGAFSMGTVPGLIILAVKNLIGLLHTSSAGIGELADFLMGAALMVPASVLYHRNKTRATALTGMAAGTLCAVLVSVLVNKWIMLPFYMGAFHMDMEGILRFANVAAADSEWKLLLLVTAPFNLLKGLVLSLVTGLIYKPLSPLLHKKG